MRAAAAGVPTRPGDGLANWAHRPGFWPLDPPRRVGVRNRPAEPGATARLNAGPGAPMPVARGAALERVVSRGMLVFLASVPARAGSGLEWLVANQNADGSHGGTPGSLATPLQCTVETLRAQAASGQTTAPSFSSALAFATAWSEPDAEFIARQIVSGALAAAAVDAPVAQLLLQQNPDGGFGRRAAAIILPRERTVGRSRSSRIPGGTARWRGRRSTRSASREGTACTGSPGSTRTMRWRSASARCSRPDAPLNELDPGKAAAALKAIRSAFTAQPWPKGTPIAQPGAWFDRSGAARTYDDPVADQVARFFDSRPWTGVDAGELLGWRLASEALLHLTPRALAHYLPAYLSALLTAPLDGVAVAVLESVTRALTPPAESDDAILAKRGGSTRTDEQRDAMEAQRARQFADLVGALSEALKSAAATFLLAFEPVFEDPDLDNPARTALDVFWRNHAAV